MKYTTKLHELRTKRAPPKEKNCALQVEQHQPY